MLFQIAWRNVWRNKIRSAVIIAAVALGLWGGTFSDAFMLGMTNQQVYSSIHTETGHFQINRPGFLVNHDMDLNLENSASIVEAVAETPFVQAVAPRLQMVSMASTATNSAGVMINGVDPEKQMLVSDLNKMTVEGAYFPPDRSNRIFIGQQLADKLKVRLNSRIVLTLTTSTGDITYGSFKVCGIFKTHNTDFDAQMVFVRRSELQALLQLPPDAASVITVLMRSLDDVDPAVATLQKRYPGLQIQKWQQLSPFVEVMSSTIAQTTILFVGIILIALAFGIVNAMLMAVMDRTREIGMLMAIGMRPGRVFRMILLETVFLSLTGAAAGLLLSMVSIAYFGKTGINLSAIGEGFHALGYSSIVYPTLGVGFYVELTLMVLVIALLAGILPARRAIQLRPAEAVRGE